MNNITKICSEEGCGGEVHARLLCHKHYQTLFKHRGRDERKYPRQTGVNIYITKGKYTYLYNKHGEVCIFDTEDLERVRNYTWTLHQGYAKTSYPNKKSVTCMHRFILGVQDIKKNLDVDHINGNGLDNRKINLRLISHRENLWNMKMKRNYGTSKYIGVCFDTRSNKWRSYASDNGKYIHIGTYLDEEKAAIARDRWVKENRGEYGGLNLRKAIRGVD